MNNDIAIRVENLGKMYRLGREVPHANTLPGKIKNVTKAPFQWLSEQLREPTEDETLWALKDVSFEIKRGEVVGFIGHNGAGKSTLLKLLSRITEPTEGYADMHGRVAALLEVGTGMHPELTGRENIYMNGTVLGMKKCEIDSKFDEIVDFSGVSKFLDTPVKRYSSGMRVRLGFAVAAHLEPEILIVDEVLSVGDAEFQTKRLGKMQDVASGGRTVLFVSHNMGAVISLCTRAVRMEGGRLVQQGDVDAVVRSYLDTGAMSEYSDLTQWHGERHGDGPIRFTSVMTLGPSGAPCSRFRSGEDITVTMELLVPDQQPSTDCIFGVSVMNNLGERILHLLNIDSGVAIKLAAGSHTISLTVPGNPLNDGEYNLELWVGDGMKVRHDRVCRCLKFYVDSSSLGPYLGKGNIRHQAVWKLPSN